MISFDIIGLLETWSDCKHEFKSLLDQYVYFDCVRSKPNNALRNSGGVGVFVRSILLRESFISHICQDFNDCVVLHIKTGVFDLMNDMILYIAYVSPEASPIYNNLHENNGIALINRNISYLRDTYPDCYVYVAGDLNSRTKHFLDYIPDDTLQKISSV